TGAAIVAFPLAVTWFNDTAAYFYGIYLGKRKLIPAVSPGKTWEGTVAGLAAGVVAGALWAAFVLDAWRNVPLDPWLGALGGL
ncbi:MAG: phosphatidate cytidylyltransferase, partial [Gemmatimonadetes bacterium]|nr:phosphatidate cytidylyltransferase [Gemmatimonadota bacterium]NIQ59963.1 phosphatidate cytidylyltransferase [Gemmatimonadota bacterium]NIU80169.1 phosphatidate cytidylyltransferase [Gammaproteobacteria bacterium]NIX48566.1 phosphatidate cytidylyltransferase [Gemmatimonadota bacterium]NIY13011.1 phosphatidate cytidylyltransferase [Gemmatimonadota bacterium]